MVSRGPQEEGEIEGVEEEQLAFKVVRVDMLARLREVLEGTVVCEFPTLYVIVV